MDEVVLCLYEVKSWFWKVTYIPFEITTSDFDGDNVRAIIFEVQRCKIVEGKKCVERWG